MKKILALAVLLVMIVVIGVGCSEANRVSENLSNEADRFNVQRRVTVFNTRTDKVLLEIIGLASIQIDSDGDLNVIVEISDGSYKKHMVNLNGWTTYVIEDISGAFVDKYHYEVNYRPEMIVPYTFTNKD
jgi:hypothetical protein